MISRIIWPLVGGVVGIAFVIVVAWVAGTFFGPFYRGDEDMNRNVVIVLAACLAFMVIGAILGFRIHRNLTSPSTRSTETRR